MSSEYNKLLERQMRKHLKNVPPSPEMKAFLTSISASYDHYEKARTLQERIMEQSSRELEERNTELRSKNEMLDSFVYRVSHDLKTPANNFVSMLRMLEEFIAKEGRAPMVQRILTNLDAASRTMQVRIADLLEMTRIEHKIADPPVQIHLTSMVNEIVNGLGAEISATGAEIKTDFAGVDYLMFGRENIASILSNLIGNAIKYHHPEKIPEIVIRSAKIGDKFELSIADNGIGMDLEKDGNRLFGMFSRMHNHVEGTGIGLFIVKKIIENNSGEIEVNSLVNHGSKFTITFPANIIVQTPEVHTSH